VIRTLSIGQASYDIYVQVDEMPKENSKTRFVNKIACGGGNAANVAYLLGKWGVSSTFAGVVGNDVFGNRIKKEFETVGVDTRYIETSYDKDTTISFVVVNTKTGTRTLFNVADEYVKLKHFDFDFQPDVIIVDGHDAYASKETIERFPKAITIMDAERNVPDVIDLAKKCKYMICSKDFAEDVSGIKIDYNNTATIVNAFDELRKKFDHQSIVITLEDKGAIYQVDNQVKVSPALMVKPVDTTGAGDVFHGAFAYVIASGGDIEKAVKFGNIAAGLSVTGVGARLSIPKLEDVNKIYEKSIQ
jgi:sulfofructose kinase